LGERQTIITVGEVEAAGGIVIPTIKYRQIKQPKIVSNNIQFILKKYVVENKARTRAIVSDVLAEALAGNYCIVISDRKNHCEELFELIQMSWEKTGIATGRYNKKHIKEQVEAFNKNEITVLVTTFSLLGEGFDVPFLNRAFVAMPFRSEAKAIQLIGRIQRSAEGKKDAVVYDYVDVGIGILENQFYNKNKDCRYGTYTSLGANVEPY
jgi:superfamily II DNA or RNA helicase